MDKKEKSKPLYFSSLCFIDTEKEAARVSNSLVSQYYKYKRSKLYMSANNEQAADEDKNLRPLYYVQVICITTPAPPTGNSGENDFISLTALLNTPH